jgi:FkbM family methyltransferase
MLTKIIKIILSEGISGIIRRIQIRYKIGNVVTSVYGIKLLSNFYDETFKMYVYGSYGNFYANRLKNEKNKFLFIDIGANQGLYLIIAAKNKNNIKSYAFEPVKKTYNLMKKNIIINNISNNKCSLFNLAISSHEKIGKMKIFSSHSGKNSIISSIKSNKSEKYVNYQSVRFINYKKLNKIISKKNCPILVKIDVEGHETVVIKQIIKSNLLSNLKEIYFEVHEKKINIKKTLNLLRKNGFIYFKKIGFGKHYDMLATK